MFRNIITLLIACCISFSLNAQEIALKKDYPERHVVVKGDTLWDISAKFLQDPWLWPKVWNFNRNEIKNPHLIYPGDVIVLDLSSGSPQFKLLREAVTVDPSIVIEPLEKTAISTISLNTIAPFLSQPLIIEHDQLKKAPRIIAGQDNRVILSPGTRIYVREILEGAPLNWHVYRQGSAMIDPETNKTLGYEATYLGDARVTKYGDPASADIIKAKEEIFTNDRLLPLHDQIAANFVPRAPDTTIQGRIMTIYGGVGEAGVGSIVTINRGSKEGLETGHVLAIKNFGQVVKDTELANSQPYSIKDRLKSLFSNEKAPDKTKSEATKPEDTQNKTALKKSTLVKLPDERTGLLMIFRVFNNISYGLIMQTEQPVNQFDAVTTP